MNDLEDMKFTISELNSMVLDTLEVLKTDHPSLYDYLNERYNDVEKDIKRILDLD